jgi:mannose-6-phosphate isomerase-like protein (cupin superfamily)
VSSPAVWLTRGRWLRVWCTKRRKSLMGDRPVVPYALRAGQGRTDNAGPGRTYNAGPGRTYNAGPGWTYNFDVDFAVKAGEQGQGRRLAIAEYATRAGQEPPDHTHATEDEIFCVLQGAVALRCGDDRFEVAGGGCVFRPRGGPDCGHQSARSQGWPRRAGGLDFQPGQDVLQDSGPADG